jgi:hypothetical protein
VQEQKKNFQFIGTVVELQHFFALSNGKGRHDAVQITTKLQAARESLQYPYDKISMNLHKRTFIE